MPDSLLAEDRARYIAHARQLGQEQAAWDSLKLNGEMAKEVKSRVKIYEALMGLDYE